jgi:lysophospholipase
MAKNAPPKIKTDHPPELKPEFTQPDGWHWDWVENDKGQRLRCGWTMPDLPEGEKPKGFVVIAPGLSEFCEKYFETIRDLKKDGFAVAILEWRGHGLSDRYLPEDRHRRHSEGFENDVADFQFFMDKLDQIRKKHDLADLKTALLAHSMGGNISLRYLHDKPEAFDSATFSAPMFGINLTATQRPILKPTCTLFNSLGKGNWYAPGQGPWTRLKYNVSKLTMSTDKSRREVQGKWFEHNPDLTAGGVTYGWLLEAYKSCETVQSPDFQKNIKTPVFIGIAENEVVVNNKDILTTAAGIKGAKVKEYEEARHELLMERNEIRGQFLRDFKNFAFNMK